MGNILSSFVLPLSNDNIIASSLISSQLIHRHTLSTCYDAIFDISLSSKLNSILISDDGRLRLFNINFDNGDQLIETNVATNKILTHEQILDIVWSIELNQFLVLTSKRLTTYDHENNLININLGLEKGLKSSPPLWRMACWSSHLILNFGLGSSIRYYNLTTTTTTTVSLINSYTRSSFGYTNSDLLSTLSLSPQLILAMNIELSNNRHVIDLFSISNISKFHRLKRINQPCPLDIITSLRNYTWLCKSHWPSDDCLCIIESDGQVKKISLDEQNGYILNLRLLYDRSHFILIRTPKKLPKEIDQDELNRIDQDEEEQSIQRQRKQIIGKLPGNLLLEIYKIPVEWK